MMSQESNLARKTAIYAIGNIGSKILAYVMVLVYSYYINPSDMGYYDLVLSTVAMVQPIIIFQINDGVYRFMIDGKHGKNKNIIGTSYRFISLTTLLSEIIFAVVAFFANLEYPVWVGLYLATTIAYVFFHDAVRGIGKSKMYAFCGIFNSLIMLSSEVIGLIFLNMGVLALLVSKVIANFLTILLIIFKNKDFQDAFRSKFDKRTFKSLLSYSAPLVPNTVCWWIVNSSDRFIILFFLGQSFNGIYSMSNKFPTVLTTITSIFYLAWQEEAIRGYDSPNRDEFFSKIFHKYSTLLFSMCLCAIPATKIVIELFVSDSYKNSWQFTGFLYLGAAFSALCSFLGLGYQISKETKRSVTTTVVAAGINILINILCVKFIGLHAASISTFLAYLFLFVIRIRHTKRYYTLSIKWTKFIILFLSSMFIIAATFVSNWLFVDILLGVIGTVVMFILNVSLVKSVFYSIKKKFRRKNYD